ncbi:thiamine-phosphate kinase [Thalassobacillus pellis]|uniref:thiamine-phosphate kinase n=1 Tax=Thalassobacillus pellis TaxID=748008 RepID=UPI001960369A|nr:thiamine-phosphate kinase [Thalassobacillus pellis]MBM7553246.1 thiamine-monophosphate kinase [Thalassobacillus pellis]
MDEFSFIDSIRQSTYSQPSLIKGIGDDAAVFRADNRDVVTAVDTLVEGVHFSRETMEPHHIGHRALAVNISDLAAMGAAPAFYMVSIVIPESWNDEDLQGIYRGMKKLARKHKMDLIGGDTVSGKELVLTVTVFGYTVPGKSRYRSAAKAGDVLFVTGTLGDAQAGLEMLLGNISNDNEEAFHYFVRRHRTPEPPVGFAMKLEGIVRVALNDLSDGIASEANEISEASDVCLHLEYEKLPYASFLDTFQEEKREQWMLSGGEDFELLGAVSEKEWPAIEKAAKEAGTTVTKIGYVTEKKQSDACVFLHKNGAKKVLTKSGYTHLQGNR